VTLDVIRDIAPGDEMYGTYPDAEVHYFSVGQSAAEAIRVCMQAAGRDRVDRILDLPCGHGRVLRYLRAMFPEAALTACDVNRDGVDFCARTFGAHTVYGQEDPARNAIDEVFDLIWCGSLLTHVDADRWGDFLRWFTSRLAGNGLLIFTTLGRLPATWVARQLAGYGLQPKSARKLVRSFNRTGFGYGNYHHSSTYGIAMASPPWVVSEVARIPTLRIVHYAEAAWDDHQDVVACVRMEAPLADADYQATAPYSRVLRILGALPGSDLSGSSHRS